MKRVLVTGASGFIGKHTLDKLVNLGYEVHAISRKEVNSDSAITWHILDLLNQNETTKLIEKIKPSHLLHLAWDVTSGYLNSPNNYEWGKASLHLIKEFEKHGGKRAVIAGTCFQYDHTDGICNEQTTPRTPKSIYGTCKQSLQEEFETFCKKTGLSGAWGYIFFLYGPDEYPNRLVPSVINSLLKNEKADCSECTQVRDFLYSKDVADAFVTILDSNAEGAINIGSGEGIELKVIVDKIAEILDKKDLLNLGARPMPKDEPPRIEADTTRLREELNWKPKYSIEDGLKTTIDYNSQYFL